MKEVEEFGGRGRQVDPVGKQVDVFLNDEHNISTQGALKKLLRAIPVFDWALRDLNKWWRGFGWQKWFLQQWLLDLPQVGLPEL